MEFHNKPNFENTYRLEPKEEERFANVNCLDSTPPR